jgi:hypothetical protein
MFHFIATIFSSSLTSFINLLIITTAAMCAATKSNNTSYYPSKHFKAFIDCKETIKRINDDWKEGDPKFCEPNFDGIGCWYATSKNSVVRIVCPDYMPGSNIKKNATRICLEDGSWQTNQFSGKEEGDYTDCNFDSHIQTADENQLEDILRVMENLDSSPYSDIYTEHAFETCIDTVLVQPKTQKGLYCPRMFDGWGCFNDTLAGQVAYIPCPDFIPGFSSEKIAHKICSESGNWYQHYLTNKTWSNYTSCVDKEDFEV